MAVTILEALQNADYNMQHAAMDFQVKIAKGQLHNAVTLLGKGYGLHEEVEPLLAKHGDVEAVPEKAEA